MINDHNKAAADRSPQDCVEEEKNKVQTFYDEVSWKQLEGGLFVKTLMFEDLTELS